ncbi:MAG: polyprenyl synthetase family protein [Kiritimatiellae bacterium]|nr:polyprenyl synthetase family protein [Kiritimatiellia bacterium]
MKEEFLAIIEKTLDEVLPKEGERPAELSEAMRYAVGAGGKRIRPLICLASAVAVGGKAEDARYPAAAIELLHNYTLVHDDLPAMDNDTERRGKPSVWAKFGEANAILAGDALQALAFKVAANAPRNVAEIVAALGAAGVGVVQGQVEDLKREGGTDGASGGPAPVPVEVVDFVYTHKTADLFVAAATMGGYAGGGDASSVGKLRTFALNLGLAFQYEDDLLDGDSPFPREKTESLVHETTAAAIAALAGLPGDTSFLKALAQKLVDRKV